MTNDQYHIFLSAYYRLQQARLAGSPDAPRLESEALALADSLTASLEARLSGPGFRSLDRDSAIEAIEQLELLSLTVLLQSSPLAQAQAEWLLRQPGLTLSQRIRLEIVRGHYPADCDAAIARLVPQARSAFDVATLLLLERYASPARRDAVRRAYDAALVHARRSPRDLDRLAVAASLAGISR